MSYSASAWSGGDNYASFYPTTPMYYDLVNIQGMYGRGVHNPGDTVYSFSDGKNYWQTIDDTGGNDTIVHNGNDAAVIDLNIMHWSDLGRSIEFSRSHTKWTVAIGPETYIENAIGGGGKDKLIGNGLANILAGRAGKDKLIGGGGADGFQFDVALTSGNRDIIKDFTDGLDIIRLAQNVFTALAPGVVTAEAFAANFHYANGILEYQGKVIAKLNGAPVIDGGDLLVV
jgi:serralysin